MTDGIASGSLIEPRRLMVCTGPCCNHGGAADVFLNELRSKLLFAATYADRVCESSCVRRSCLGKCTGEPLAYVHPDGVWYHQLSFENLLLILRGHVLDGQRVPALILDEDE